MITSNTQRKPVRLARTSAAGAARTCPPETVNPIRPQVELSPKGAPECSPRFTPAKGPAGSPGLIGRHLRTPALKNARPAGLDLLKGRPTIARTGASRLQRGSALLLVLITILLVSSLIISAVEFIRHDVDEYAVFNRRFRCRTLAQTGVAYALAPQVRNEDRPLLEQTAADGGRFRVVIASESARLNINFLLQTGRDYLLQRLFRSWGLSSREIDPALAGLHRYTAEVDATGPGAPAAAATPTPAPLPSPQQPAAAGTPTGSPSFRAFQAVEEMSLVPEFWPVMRQQPDWAQFFTVYGDGKIDVNTVDQATLQLLTGVSPAQADRFVKYRWGRDGIPFTADDQIYRSMEEVRVNLGLSPQQFQVVQDLLSLTSAVDRIESTGIFAGFTTNITTVVNRNAVPAQIILWQER
ncbi:MAG: general secretion pathway protein GspK [Verrucomicrobia bacterium]|nr:general secretion pathway protein GspK [Verrucomicrobiota bacterium]